MEDVKVSSRSFTKKSKVIKFRKAKGFHSTLIGIISLIIVSLSLVSYICFVERDEKFEDIEGNRHALASLSTGIGNEFSGFVSRRRLSEDDANKGDKRSLCNDGAQKVKVRYTGEKRQTNLRLQRARARYLEEHSNLQLSAERLKDAVYGDEDFVVFELGIFRKILEETLNRVNAYEIARESFAALMVLPSRSAFSDSLPEIKSQLEAARVGSELLLNSFNEGPLPDDVDLGWLVPFVKDLKTKTIVDSKKEQRVQKTHHVDDVERGRAILYISSEESD